jgi:hypothetical protein
MRVILIVCCIIGIMSSGYPQNDTYVGYSATTSQVSLQVSVAGGATYENLEPGMAYRTVAVVDPSSINITQFNGEEIFSPAQVEIEGAPYAQIVVTVLLPSRLQPYDAKIGYIDMIYDNHSASVLDPATGDFKFFNPTSGISISLPGDGANTVIFLGGNPTVVPPSSYGIYNGIGIIVVEYT